MNSDPRPHFLRKPVVDCTKHALILLVPVLQMVLTDMLQGWERPTMSQTHQAWQAHLQKIAKSLLFSGEPSWEAVADTLRA